MLQQPRLPYVRFTTDATETKDADGHSVFKNVYTVHIMPIGGKDEVIKNADEWLKELEQKAMTRGPFDSNASEYREWHERFTKMFAQYKAGEEMVTEGTPLRAVLAFTKAETMQAESVRIFSIEQLAEANEEAIARMGIGGRALKDKATQVLKAKGSNHLAEENAALRVQIEDLTRRVDDLIASGLVEKRRGRQPATEQPG